MDAVLVISCQGFMPILSERFADAQDDVSKCCARAVWLKKQRFRIVMSLAGAAEDTGRHYLPGLRG
jgi:hypothetical protein